MKDRAHARDSRRTADAVTYCITEQMSRVRIVLAADDPSPDVLHYPFGNRRRQRPAEESEALKRKRERLLERAESDASRDRPVGAKVTFEAEGKRKKPPQLD